MRRDARGEKYIRADGAALAHGRFAAHDGRAGINRHVVLNNRMALLPAQQLARRERLRHQAHALIHLHVVADDARFADDRAGAVVHEKVRANPRARMQIHARAAVRPLAHDARDQRDILLVKLVRESMHRDGFNKRVRDNNFFFAQPSKTN